MAKKKKSKVRSFIIKFILITLLVAGVGFGIGIGIIHVFKNSDYFRIQAITIDSSLQFIDKRDLKNLIGKNIFDVDIKAVQRRLSYKYPQASELKVIKHFPGQIAVVAKQRLPFARLQKEEQTIILDEEGVVLSSSGKEQRGLPFIIGANIGNLRIVRGVSFRGTDIRTALEVIRCFQAEKSLSSYSINEINVGNSSKIILALSNDLKIFLDQNKIAQKIRVLGVVLSQDTLNLKDVNYVDLRFKEPIIGKR